MRRVSVTKRLQYNVVTGLFVLAISLSSLTGIFVMQTVYAADEGLSTITNKTVLRNEVLAITDIEVTGTGDDQVSLTLWAENGQFSINDSGITATGNSTDTLTLAGSRTNINSALLTLEYTSATLGDDEISLELGSNVTTNVIIDPNSGRAYTISTQALTWNQARDAAKELWYGGVQGYLANVTSAEEDTFIRNNLTGNGWLGASDQDGPEGNWKWMDGPEAGTSFWSGLGAGNGGQPVLGPGDVPFYSNWNSSEPNDSSGGEDCGEYIIGSGWNDLPCNSITRPYVVEFGAVDGDAPAETVEGSFTITTAAHTRNVATCDDLLVLGSDNALDIINLTTDIDCAGYEVEPLFDGNSFGGTLEGSGHTIHNVTINDPDSYNIGLLSDARGATIRNLTLNNFNISGDEYVGALAGYAESSIISNVHIINATINSTNGYIGGLAGQAYGYSDGNTTHIEKSSVSGGTIMTDGNNAGGLIGQVELESAGTILIEQTFTDIDIVSTRDSSSADTGGFIGEINLDLWDDSEGSITLRDVYSWGDVYVPAGENIGGLVGRVGIYTDDSGDIAELNITRAYAKGAVTARNEAGGLIGQVSELDGYGDESYELINTFAMGKVTILEDEAVYQGGLIGRNEVQNSGLTSAGNRWDDKRTNQFACSTQDDTGEALDDCIGVNATGNQPSYFINNDTNAPMSTWDFDTVWVANIGNTPTFKPVVDEDNDGISDEIESSAPNSGDGNNDNLPDSAQHNVTSLVSPLSGEYITLAVDASCSLSEVSITSENRHNIQDDTYDYQSGFVTFTATGCEDAQTDVALYYHGVELGDYTVRKYNPTTDTYFTIAGTDLTGLSSPLSGTLVNYTIIDNGELDIDDEEGVITDPVGLASTVAGAPNTGLGQHTMVPYIIAGIAGCGLLITIAIYSRKKVYSFVRSKK